MGRYRKYSTAKALSAAVDGYFDSISRTVAATEMAPTGRHNKAGNPVMERVPVYNDSGNAICYREFVIFPSVTAMCEHIGISRDTWATYSSDQKLEEVCRRAKAKIEGWLEAELVTRQKGVDGIKFALENNYGWKNKHEFDGTVGGIEKFLEGLPTDNEF